jgi:hypothetical protein
MSQFKSGDVALIINSINEENIGRVVTVAGIAVQGQRIDQEDGAYVISDIDGMVIVEGDIVVSAEWLPTHKTVVRTHVFRPNFLMPLRGNFQPEQQKSLEVVE